MPEKLSPGSFDATPSVVIGAAILLVANNAMLGNYYGTEIRKYRRNNRQYAGSADQLRIPAKATMDSDAWRPLDPVDDDQGGA
ncbi:MAG TPA: hypothetical protein VEN78_39300 [Bradyrhizobium sp.]|nr:hypothetical protein [Bradyrhizobium sp.]